MRGGDPSTLASSLSGGNQQKVAVAREVASNPKLLIAHQPTRGLDVGAIEFVHGRLLEERDKGRGILLVSLEFEEIRALADRILVIYEGQIVGRVPAGRLRGGARRGDDRRSRRPGGGVSATEEPEVRAATPASRLASYVRGGGVIVPLLTTLIAFLIGGLVMLVTGADPIDDLQGDLEGHRASSGSSRGPRAPTATSRRSNLQQTLIITTPLILTGLAVAFAFRAGLFNIGGNGQYIVGSIARGLGRLVLRRHAELPPHPAGDPGCLPGGRGVGGHRRRAEGCRRAPTR